MHAIDRQGNVVTKQPFSFVGDFADGLAPATAFDERRTGTTSGFIGKDGEVIVPLEFEKVFGFRCGIGRVTSARAQQRFVTRAGTFLLDGGFSWTSDFSDGIGLAYTGGKPAWLALDATGNVLFESNDESILPFSSGLAAVRRNGLWGFIDAKGETVIEPRFEAAMAFDGDRARVKIDGQLRLIDREGSLVGDAFEWSKGLAHPSSEGMTVVYAVDPFKIGFLGPDGKLAVPFVLDGSRAYAEGTCAASVASRWGFIDKSGTFVIEPQFEDVWPFSDGLACVRRGGLWGFIDRAGEMVIEPQFAESQTQFSDGLASVRVP
jgi:hypothetical protein